MPQSESVAKLAAALSAAQGEFGAIKKQQDNPFFKSKYADLSAVLEAVQPSLTKHELAVIQSPSTDADKKTVSVETMLMHSSGEWKSSVFEMPVADWKAQGIGSVVTYLRRYSIGAVLNIAAEDDDGNEASGRGEGSHQPQPNKPAPQSSAAPRQAQTKPAPKKTESVKPDPPKAEPPKAEATKQEAEKKEEPTTPQKKLRALLVKLWNDTNTQVNGKQIKDFIIRGTAIQDKYKDSSNVNLEELTDTEAEGAYNTLKDAYEKGTINELLTTESK
jgi:hypothetical protein